MSHMFQEVLCLAGGLSELRSRGRTQSGLRSVRGRHRGSEEYMNPYDSLPWSVSLFLLQAGLTRTKSNASHNATHKRISTLLFTAVHLSVARHIRTALQSQTFPFTTTAPSSSGFFEAFQRCQVTSTAKHAILSPPRGLSTPTRSITAIASASSKPG